MCNYIFIKILFFMFFLNKKFTIFLIFINTIIIIWLFSYFLSENGKYHNLTRGVPHYARPAVLPAYALRQVWANEINSAICIFIFAIVLEIYLLWTLVSKGVIQKKYAYLITMLLLVFLSLVSFAEYWVSGEILYPM
jgi:hypothetical protein